MDSDEAMHEVEDIMRDQVIISTELDVDFQTKRSTITISATKLRLAVAVLADTLFPTVVNVYYAYLRNQKTVVENVRRQLWPTLLAVMVNYVSRSLSSVQRGISFPLTLRQMRASENEIHNDYAMDDSPEKSVDCTVLNSPEGPIKADVIFIHGLHGSLDKTWKQGSWRHEKHKIFHQNLRQITSSGEVTVKPGHGTLKRAVSYESYMPSKIARSNIHDSINSSLMADEEEKCHGEDYSSCWPMEWIPKDCPGVRVIALNYTTDPYLWRPLWIKKRNRTNMVDRSDEMIGHLKEIGVGNHPIIWVGHSKGGLFIKQIIINSRNKKEEPIVGEIYAQTKAILFFSVPHRGSIFADFNLPLLRRSVELTEIQRNCPFVLDLHEQFVKIFQDQKFSPKIFSFIETSFTLMSFIYLKIVAFESADPGFGDLCGVPLDHREICKPAGRDCFMYKKLIGLIESVLDSDSNYQSFDES